MMSNLCHNGQFALRFWLLTGILFLPVILPAQTSEFNFATGSVKGRNHVGGLTGRIGESGGAIRTSYARGSVTGEGFTGGLAGSNAGSIVKSYATGKVTGTSNSGGLTGSGSGTVADSYWDIQTSLQNASAGGTGRNSDPMTWPYASDTYTGWDFTAVWKADNTPFLNNGYPLLAASEVCQVTVQVYPPGAGTISGDGYYLSGQQAQLQAAANQAFDFKGWIRNTELISSQLNYSLKVAGNSSLVARFELKATSITDKSFPGVDELRIYPNPVKDLLWIEFLDREDVCDRLTVVDISGQTIREIDTGKESYRRISLDVTVFKPGVYFIRASHRKGFSSAKFLKY